MRPVSGLGRVAASLALLLLAGCAVPVAGALDDDEANRVVVALDRASVDATKEPDPSADNRWRVMVARDEVPRALSALRDEELPRTPPAGVLDAVGKGSLVPSEAAEHAQLVAGVAGDLQRSLEGVEGVLSARVHLSLPEASPLRDPREPGAGRPSASVLLVHRGSTPPLSADSVQRLVAGGVAGMVPGDVTVVLVSRAAPAALPGGGLGHVGPIAVARTSLRELQAALVGLLALVALLAGATLLLYSRLVRIRAEIAARPPAKP
jgi:type III secretion protein J